MSNDERTGNVVTDTDKSKLLALTGAMRAIMIETPYPKHNHGERVVHIAARTLLQVDPEAYTAALVAKDK